MPDAVNTLNQWRYCDTAPVVKAGYDVCIKPSDRAGSSDNKETLNRIVASVAEKAGCKSVKGQKHTYTKRGFWDNLERFLAGGRNNNTTHDAFYDSGHLVSIRVLQALANDAKPSPTPAQTNTPNTDNTPLLDKKTHRELLDESIEKMNCNAQERENLLVDFLANKKIISTLTAPNQTEVRDRIARQDFRRFRPYMCPTDNSEAFAGHKAKNASDSKVEASTTQAVDDSVQVTLNNVRKTYARNNVARTLTRISRFFTGLTECTSAPTGFVSKSFRNLFLGGREEGSLAHKAFGPFFTILAGIAATTVMGMFASTLENVFTGGAETVAMLATWVAQFAMISAFFGFMSYAFGIASNVVYDKKQTLWPSQETAIAQETSVLVTRISELMDWVNQGENSTGSNKRLNLLSESLTKGNWFNAKFRKSEINPETQRPFLVEQLIKAQTLKNDFKNKSGAERRLQRQYHTALAIGNYVSGNFKHPDGSTPDKSERAQLRRELQVAALCMRVNNSKVNKGKDFEKASAAKRNDSRVEIEETYMNKMMHRKMLTGGAMALLRMFANPNANFKRGNWAHKAAERLKHWASETYAAERDKRYSNPALHHRNKYKSLYMSRHVEEYGPITRFFIRAGETFNNISSHLILAQNAQSSRLFGSIFKKIQQHVLVQPPSHSLNSALGRGFGGLAVAALLALGFSDFGLGGINDVAMSNPYTFEMSAVGNFSLLAVGTLMACAMLPGAICQAIAMISARCGGHNSYYRPDPSKLLVLA